VLGPTRLKRTALDKAEVIGRRSASGGRGFGQLKAYVIIGRLALLASGPAPEDGGCRDSGLRGRP
jgi:hypothetical protein